MNTKERERQKIKSISKFLRENDFGLSLSPHQLHWQFLSIFPTRLVIIRDERVQGLREGQSSISFLLLFQSFFSQIFSLFLLSLSFVGFPTSLSYLVFLHPIYIPFSDH